jgi:ABC-2 type transport system ATP-binding protein
MSSKSLLKVSKLEKSFGSFKAVDNIDFNVYEGDIYGFLGPNGAGKSTTLRMILGLIKPNSGDIYINDESIFGNKRKFLNNIGALIERPDFHKNLTGYQNLKILFKLSGIKNKTRIDDVLNDVGLYDKKDQKVGGYSQGMKQRLGIAQTLLHEPSLIILDEPSNGLDPQGQADMRSLILKINKSMGITIIISSHILNEIEKISNRMIVINKGKKIVEGYVTELMNNDSLRVSFKTDETTILQDFFNKENISFNIKDDTLVAPINENEISPLISKIVNNNIQLREVKQLKTLEELFLDLTK